jgi:hypothetical protein
LVAANQTRAFRGTSSPCHELDPTQTLGTPALPASQQAKTFKSFVQDPQVFWQSPVMSAVSRELARQALLDEGRAGDADSLAWSPLLVRFPHPEMTTLSFTGRVIAPCIFAACMFGAVTQVGFVAGRRAARRVEVWGSARAPPYC